MSPERRELSPWFLAAVAGVGILVHGALAVSLGKGYAIPTTIIGIMGGAAVLLGPVGKALAQRLHGAPTTELPPDQVLNELDELRSRVAELEERADFSERLLAKQREGTD